ncbi:MAG: VanW family protein [bacterium]|nr:VanW family protein [bacterium]
MARHQFKKISILFGWGVLVLGAVFLAVLTAYHFAYRGRILPHIYFQETLLTNLTSPEAKEKIEQIIADSQGQSFVFTFKGQSFSFAPTELGLSYQAQETTQQAYGLGRSENMLANLRGKWVAWAQGIHVEPAYVVDEAVWNTAVENLARRVDKPVQEAQFVLSQPAGGPAGGLGVAEEMAGQALSREEFRRRVLAKFLSFSFSEEELPVSKVEPSLSREDLLPLQSQVAPLVFSPFKITFEEKVWEPKPEEILTFLTFTKSKLVSPIQVNRSRLGDYLRQIGKEIYVAPKGEIFRLDGNKVVDFAPSIAGRELDEDQALVLLSTALLDLRQRTVSLPVQKLEATGGKNEYGIHELVGEGMTNWGKSSANRIHNITLASSKLSGVLIPPGAIFSLNESVGDVSEKTGYKKEYVILRGETVLGDGGGLCQVSTTVFRSALYAGLPIVERLPHAYRVGYYEPPLGFDATVFPPSVDLKFKNDTPAHLLLQASWDKAKGELWFKLYGTSDGRKTEFEGPFNKDYIAPPEPRYQDDPTLPRGETKQKERAITGVTSEFRRKITWPDGRTQAETFKSKYQPWQAVFLVGTKD